MEFLKNLFSLEGQVALVTGGTGVLGGAMAQALAQAGAKVAVMGRRREQADATVAAIEAAGGVGLALPADVLVRDQLESARSALLERWGRLDILVNAAGGNLPSATLPPGQSFFNLPVEGMEPVIALNLQGTLLPSQVFGAELARAGKGCIVNISSMAGVNGTAGVGAYSAAKAGLQMFTRVSSSEWGAYGIRVNCIACGMIATEAARQGWETKGFDAAGASAKSFALGRYGEMREAAQAIVFMASDASSYVSGETLAVGGGPKLGGMISLD